MNYDQTSNPVLNGNAFQGERVATELMSVSGCIHKTALCLGLVFLSALFAWNTSYASGEDLVGKVLLFSVFSLVVALVTCFRPYIAKFTAPLYSLLQGLVLGSTSMLFERAYPGIAVQAVVLTFGVFAAMLAIYRTGLIQVSERFVTGVVAATAGIAIVYIANLLFVVFGGSGFSFMHSSSAFSIGFSLIVVAIAALNLVLDFDFVVRQSRRGAPKELEWYAAFGLMVTLIWLYMEVLRLLSKLRSRR